LSTEILLVDEVLAVGDAQFQKKCLGKMGSVAKQGRTVLFVSHNMSAVQSLCSRAIYLQGGRLKAAGSLQEGIQLYHQGLQDNSESSTGAEVEMRNLTINGSLQPTVHAGSPLEFRFDLLVRVAMPALRLFVVLENSQGLTVLHTVKNERELSVLREPGRYTISVRVPALWVTPGLYSYHTKLICHGIDLQGRYLSDKILVSVESDYDPEMAPGLLSPPVRWAAQKEQPDLAMAVDNAISQG
jgi:lipopolysaccharide transport system ATP-binding protein